MQIIQTCRSYRRADYTDVQWVREVDTENSVLTALIIRAEWISSLKDKSTKIYTKRNR